MSIFNKAGEINGDTSDHYPKDTPQTRSGSSSDTSGEVSIVGRGVRIEGDVHVKGDVRIGGRINGAVFVQERFVVAIEGIVLGGIEAGEGDIAGKVEGDIVTRGRLIVRKSASILGKITAKSLMVEDGAAIDGICKVGKPNRINSTREEPGDDAEDAKPTLLPFGEGGMAGEGRADAG